MSAACADKVGIEGEAIDGSWKRLGSALYDPPAAGQPRSRQGVAPQSLTLWLVELDGEGGAPSPTKAPLWRAGFGIVRVWRRELVALGKLVTPGCGPRRPMARAAHIRGPHRLDVVLAVGRIRELLAQLADE